MCIAMDGVRVFGERIYSDKSADTADKRKNVLSWRILLLSVIVVECA